MNIAPLTCVCGRPFTFIEVDGCIHGACDRNEDHCSRMVCGQTIREAVDAAKAMIAAGSPKKRRGKVVNV